MNKPSEFIFLPDEIYSYRQKNKSKNKTNKRMNERNQVHRKTLKYGYLDGQVSSSSSSTSRGIISGRSFIHLFYLTNTSAHTHTRAYILPHKTAEDMHQNNQKKLWPQFTAAIAREKNVKDQLSNCRRVRLKNKPKKKQQFFLLGQVDSIKKHLI